MANITRIKASDPGKPKDEPKGKPKDKPKDKSKNQPVKTTPKPVEPKTDKTSENKANEAKKLEKKTKKSSKKPFILIRPLVYFGRYLRDSWHEIRQVRWPSRKATWKLFFAILIYTLLFGAIIMLLDIFFTWLFNTII